MTSTKGTFGTPNRNGRSSSVTSAKGTVGTLYSHGRSSSVNSANGTFEICNVASNRKNFRGKKNQNIEQSQKLANNDVRGSKDSVRSSSSDNLRSRSRKLLHVNYVKNTPDEATLYTNIRAKNKGKSRSQSIDIIRTYQSDSDTESSMFHSRRKGAIHRELSKDNIDKRLYTAKSSRDLSKDRYILRDDRYRAKESRNFEYESFRVDNVNFEEKKDHDRIDERLAQLQQYLKSTLQ